MGDDVTRPNSEPSLDELIARLEAPRLPQRRKERKPVRLPHPKKDVSDVIREIQHGLDIAYTFLPEGTYTSPRTGALRTDLAAALQAFEDFANEISLPPTMRIPPIDPNRPAIVAQIGEATRRYGVAHIATAEIALLAQQTAERYGDVIRETLTHATQTLTATLLGVHAYATDKGYERMQAIGNRLTQGDETYAKNVTWLLDVATLCDKRHEPISEEAIIERLHMLPAEVCGKRVHVPREAMKDLIRLRGDLSVAIDDAAELYTHDRPYASDVAVAIRGIDRTAGRGIVAAVLRAISAKATYEAALVQREGRDEPPDDLARSLTIYTHLRLLDALSGISYHGALPEEVRAAEGIVLWELAHLQANQDQQVLRLLGRQGPEVNPAVKETIDYLERLVNGAHHELGLLEKLPNATLPVTPRAQKTASRFTLSDFDGLTEEDISGPFKYLLSGPFRYRPLLRDDG